MFEMNCFGVNWLVCYEKNKFFMIFSIFAKKVLKNAENVMFLWKLERFFGIIVYIWFK